MRLKKHIRQVIREEISEVPKESYLKYKKLLDKLVDDVFTDFVCGYSWETFNLHHREGTQLRIILYTKNMENLNFELYGQKKQELYNLINDFFPKFNGIFITTDTTKCGEELNESEITERCWKGYTQKGMKTMFGKRYPNCVKIKKKKESKEGVGGYAAPAFEMEPDHVHFKHQYNESSMLPHTKRRLHKIHELLESLMYDAHNPCDYNDKDEYFDELVYDLGWMVRNERYGLSDADWIDIYEYIVEHKQDEIKQYYTDSCVGKLRGSIKNIIDEEVQKKYSKPTEKVDKLVYNWLDRYFKGSQMNYKKSYESTHSFEWCNNGNEICDLRLYFDVNYDVYNDKRPTSERQLESATLSIPKDVINDLSQDIPVRRNYLRYLIEEWFEDNLLSVVQQKMERNDIYITEFTEHPDKSRVCVPPVKKPEDITDQEMMDYIKANTLFSYKDMEKYEAEEPGWVEKTYLDKLHQKEYERLNG